MTGSQETQNALADIDRKLRELQQELAHVFEHPQTSSLRSGAEVPPPSAPSPSAEGTELVEQAAILGAQLTRHIRVLQTLQDALERSTSALTDAYRAHSAARDAQGTFRGEVTVNAGPFTDIGTLGAFEHALASLRVVEDVHVRSYEGNRALVDLRLGVPAQLVEEVRRALPVSFEVTGMSEQELTIELDLSSRADRSFPVAPPSTQSAGDDE